MKEKIRKIGRFVRHVAKFIKNSCGFMTKKGAWIDYDEVHALAYGFLMDDEECVLYAKEEGNKLPRYVHKEPHYYLLGKNIRDIFE